MDRGGWLRPPDAYEAALLACRQDLLTMGGEVLGLVTAALESLGSGATFPAREVLAGDDRIDEQEASLEFEILELLSLKQPRAEDLRYLYGLGRMARDLERIADYAGDLAEIVLEGSIISGVPPILEEMGRLTREMLAQSLAAVDPLAADQARQVIQKDDAVDAHFRALREELLVADAPTVSEAVSLFLVGRYLERMADHAVNLAESIVFWETGERRPRRGKRPWPG